MGGETVPERSEAVLVESLVKRYGELIAVDGLSLRIARGGRFSACWAPTARARRRPSTACCSC